MSSTYRPATQPTPCTSAATRWSFGAVYGPPFVRAGDVRRDAKMADFRNFSRLAQSFTALDSAGGVIVEPKDAPFDSRHLDMAYALQTVTDKIYMGNVVSDERPDTLAMTEILFGGRDVIERTPAIDLDHQLQLAQCGGTAACSTPFSSTPRPLQQRRDRFGSCRCRWCSHSRPGEAQLIQRLVEPGLLR